MPKKAIVRRLKFVGPQRHKGLDVVGGPKPTGKLPVIVGDGIFGYPGSKDGIFSMGKPLNRSGVFFNPYATSNLELEQPDTEWVLERRPGQPLYPGAVGRGLVLIGPSMGSLDNSTSKAKMFLGGLIGGAVGFTLWKFLKKQ
jgi:hypothetical protein